VRARKEKDAGEADEAAAPEAIVSERLPD
jgi:hypothetical protein